MKSNRILCTLLLLPSVLAGCYKQIPLSSTPVPATRIVAVLTDSGTVAMGNALGAGAQTIEGVVTKATDREWTLAMLRVDHRDGRSQAWNREPVSFPRPALTDPVVVVLDKKRSWLAAAGIVVGALTIARSFNLFGGDETPPDGPAPAAIIIPLPGGRK